MRNTRTCLAGLIILVAACTEGAAREPGSVRPATTPATATMPAAAGEAIGPAPSEPAAATATTPGVTGDSILPMAVMIARFQGELAPVTALGDGAARSRDELVARVAAAVADSSAAALHDLTLNAAEFGHLYFPSSIYAREPYAQPPTVTWLLMEQNSLKGMSRLLRRFGGSALAVAGHDCAGEPKVEGGNRIHEQCTVRMRGDDGRVEDVRLFGSIIERDDRYKLMSMSNRL